MPLFLPFIFPLWFSFQSLFLFSLVFLCILLFSILSCLSISHLSVPLSLFITTPFYTICNCRIHHFFPSTAFASLWVSLQDCPLAYWLPNHYLCSKCVGCTTFHSQTKLLVLFLTSLYFFFTHLNKD